MKKGLDHGSPALLGVVLVAVGVDGLGRVGAQRRHCRDDRRVDEHHGPALAIQLQEEVGTAAEHLDHVADDRQPGVTHHGFEVAARRGFGHRMLGPIVGQQPLLEQTHAGQVRIGDVVTRRFAWSSR